MTISANKPLEGKVWRQLQAHAQHVSSLHLNNLLTDDARFAACSISLDGLFADFSRCRVTTDTLRMLRALAAESGVANAIESLFNGARVNRSEDRAALHTSLRASKASGPQLDGTNIAALVDEERERFLAFADAIRCGDRCSSVGEAFRTVINIGIGGSDLGPRFVADALSDASEGPAVYFVAGLDGIELQRALRHADPATTLVIVCSKTFTTQETMSNARAAQVWLRSALGDKGLNAHFAAVSANDEAMTDFGIAADARFAMWDWVGGRYSVWSAVGLSAAIAIGSDRFRELLRGANRMDRHFRTAPLEQNLPVMLALITVWQQNFLGDDQHVVLPYDQRLAGLPVYLQQLWMESLGKGVSSDGAVLNYVTGSALWGASGSHAQHSFAQWLHQGAARAVTVYIGVVEGIKSVSPEIRQASLANMLAQADSLAGGCTIASLEGAEQQAHKVHPGNRPSVVLLLRRLDPATLGALLAVYEHSVYVQAVIWGINPFDQWGVEFGKQVARQYEAALKSGTSAKLPVAGQQVIKWTS